MSLDLQKKERSLAIIGGGNMGAAMVKAFIAAGVCNASEIIIIERDADRRVSLESELGCVTSSEIADVSLSETVMLAIKPQDCLPVAEKLAACLKKNQLLISILAGTSLKRLSELFGSHPAIIRAMPNTPAKIGVGMTVFTESGGVTAAQRIVAERLFKACGEVLRVSEDVLVNSATAVSGSGPAYLFFLAEQMVSAATDLGFNVNEARLIVNQTLRGSAQLLSESNETPEALRKAVTSKGGTTEAALNLLNDRDVGGALRDAVKRAAERGVELEKVNLK